MNGPIVISYYGLELHGSYYLTSDNDARELHFNLKNGKKITIPSKNIYSHEVDIQSDIVRLEIWAGAQNRVQPLSLSASSVWEIDRMLDDITGDVCCQLLCIIHIVNRFFIFLTLGVLVNDKVKILLWCRVLRKCHKSPTGCTCFFLFLQKGKKFVCPV